MHHDEVANDGDEGSVSGAASASIVGYVVGNGAVATFGRGCWWTGLAALAGWLTAPSVALLVALLVVALVSPLVAALAAFGVVLILMTAILEVWWQRWSLEDRSVGGTVGGAGAA